MAASDSPIIEIDGAYFYRGADRFVIRGLVYQLHPRSAPQTGERYSLDPLQDSRYEDLERDVEMFRELNINALWVNRHDVNVSHTRCMNLLAEHGIYVIFKPFPLGNAISRVRPYQSYTAERLQTWAKLVDSIAQFRNTIGLCVATNTAVENGVPHGNNLHEFRDVVSRMIRDMKQYMRYRYHDVGQRVLPLTVTDSHWSSLDAKTFHYFADLECEDRVANGRVDFYCFYHDESAIGSRQLSRQYTQLAAEVMPRPIAPGVSADNAGVEADKDQLAVPEFNDVEDAIPIVISEFAKNYRRPRTFSEVTELYGRNMSSPLLNILSGGFIHQFSEFYDELGLVKDTPSGDRQILFDYYNFRNAMHEVVGTLKSNIRNPGMTTFNRPIQLILDFDGTLTTKDTLHLVAEAGYRRQRYDKVEPQPEPWEDISRAYESDYTTHEVNYGRDGFLKGTIQGEFEWLDSLSTVETASAERAFAAGIFSNVTMQDLELAAADSLLSRQIEMRPGWSNLLAQVNRINKRTTTHMSDPLMFQIFSVNWSRWFVWSVINKAALALEKSSLTSDAKDAIQKLAIYANEMPSIIAEQPTASEQTPPPRGSPIELRTAGDKLKQFRSAVGKYSPYIPRPLAVYIGDSATDFECLVMADVGICVGEVRLGKSLQVACEKSGIRVNSLANFQYRERERSIATLDELERYMLTHEVTIYHARNLHEVAQWLSRLSDDVTLSQPQQE